MYSLVSEPWVKPLPAGCVCSCVLFAVLQIFGLLYVNATAITSAARQQILAWSLRQQVELCVDKFVNFLSVTGYFEIVLPIVSVFRAAEEG